MGCTQGQPVVEAVPKSEAAAAKAEPVQALSAPIAQESPAPSASAAEIKAEVKTEVKAEVPVVVEVKASEPVVEEQQAPVVEEKAPVVEAAVKVEEPVPAVPVIEAPVVEAEIKKEEPASEKVEEAVSAEVVAEVAVEAPKVEEPKVEKVKDDTIYKWADAAPADVDIKELGTMQPLLKEANKHGILFYANPVAESMIQYTNSISVYEFFRKIKKVEDGSLTAVQAQEHLRDTVVTAIRHGKHLVIDLADQKPNLALDDGAEFPASKIWNKETLAAYCASFEILKGGQFGPEDTTMTGDVGFHGLTGFTISILIKDDASYCQLCQELSNHADFLKFQVV